MSVAKITNLGVTCVKMFDSEITASRPSSRRLTRLCGFGLVFNIDVALNTFKTFTEHNQFNGMKTREQLNVTC